MLINANHPKSKLAFIKNGVSDILNQSYVSKWLVLLSIGILGFLNNKQQCLACLKIELVSDISIDQHLLGFVFIGIAQYMLAWISI